jgi:hypothetical protein
MSDLLLGLSAAVVKCACQAWLKDSDFAKEASTSVVDLIAAKVSGDLDRRRARRFFEDLEIPISRKLSVLRETEYSDVPDNEWSAAVLIAGETFDRAQLSADILISADLDPLFLERQIRRGSPSATRDLTAGGTALYDRIISEGCSYIIQIADNLPRIQVGAFAELLSRTTQLLTLISGLLDDLPRHEGVAEKSQRFATGYRRHIAIKLDRLEIFGVDFPSRKYPLTVAYISLQARGGQPETGDLRIESVLANNPRSLLVGPAGSGKTTLLQWLAVRAAKADFSGELKGWNDAFPFLIRLRNYVNRDLPRPQDFVEGISPHLAGEMPDGFVHELMRSGRALILVDGIDELPEDRRIKVTEWLNDLVTSFPNARYVVTSRPAAMGEPWPRLENLSVAEVLPMTPSNVRIFADHWHAAVGTEIVEPEEKEALAACKKSLLGAITSDRHLYRLAVNPLLAALMCALNLARSADLPRNRQELYEAALSMLLDQRDKKRGVLPAYNLGLSKSDKIMILSDLALWMVRNGLSEAPGYRIKDQVARSLSKLRDLPLDTSVVFRYLLERSGLLTEPAKGQVDFIHRTFQEYLAAKAAVDNDAVDELIRNVNNDNWREVILMASGLARQGDCEELICGLLELEPATPRIKLLAVGCLRAARQLDPNIRRDAEDLVRTLLPPHTVEEAELLSGAGELLLDLLPDYPPRTEQEAMATIRAAALIGGERAARALMLSMPNKSGSFSLSNVGRELINAWLDFEPLAYGEFVLTALNPRSLTVPDGRVLPSIEFIRDVSYLKVEGVTSYTDLTPVSNHSKLEDLRIYCYGELTPNLSPLVKNRSLEQLMIIGAEDSDFARLPLGRPPALSSLYISDWYNVSTTAGLSGWAKGLRILSFQNCPALSDISTLTNNESLEQIVFSSVPNALDVEPALTMSNLRKITIHNSRIANPEVLRARRDIEVSVQRAWTPESTASSY